MADVANRIAVYGSGSGLFLLNKVSSMYSAIVDMHGELLDDQKPSVT